MVLGNVGCPCCYRRLIRQFQHPADIGNWPEATVHHPEKADLNDLKSFLLDLIEAERQVIDQFPDRWQQTTTGWEDHVHDATFGSPLGNHFH